MEEDGGGGAFQRRWTGGVGRRAEARRCRIRGGRWPRRGRLQDDDEGGSAWRRMGEAAHFSDDGQEA
jgi:hypothetical protein